MYKKIQAKIASSPKLTGVITRLKTAHWMFIAILLTAGFGLVVMVPPFWGNDEAAHFARTYQLTGGQIKSPKVAGPAYGGYIPQNIVGLFNHVSNDALNNPNTAMASKLAQRSDVNRPSGFEAYTSQKRSDQLVPMTFPATAAYTPVAYIPSGVGMVIARVFDVTIGNFFLLSRSTTLLGYGAIVFLALYVLRHRKIKWLVFSVALLPNAIIGASLVSADSLLLGLSLLFFALVIYAFEKSKDVTRSRWLIPALAAVAIILPLTKPAYFPLTFLFLLLPTRLWANVKTSVVYKVATVGTGMLFLALWLYFIKDISSAVPLIDSPAFAAQVNPQQQLLFLLQHLTAIPSLFYNTMLAQDPLLTVGAIGVVGWNSALIPAWLAAASFGGILLAVFYNNENLQQLRRPLFAAAALGLATFFAIFATFYVAYTPVGASLIVGVQGRYFAAVFVYILACLPLLVPVRVTMPERVAPVLFGCLAATIAAATVVFYYSILY